MSMFFSVCTIVHQEFQLQHPWIFSILAMLNASTPLQGSAPREPANVSDSSEMHDNWKLFRLMSPSKSKLGSEWLGIQRPCFHCAWFLVASHIHLEWCVKCQTDQADPAWRFSPNLRASISLLPSKSSLASPESRSGSWSSWQFQWHSWKNYGTVLSPTPIVIITTLNCKTTIYKSWQRN